MLVRHGKGDRRREAGMGQFGFQQLGAWQAHRVLLAPGPLFCVIDGTTRGRRWSATAARSELREPAATSGVRRGFAPHQLRHAHAVELAREGIAVNIIQRQLGHTDLGTTSTYLQGIDPSENRRCPLTTGTEDLDEGRTGPLILSGTSTVAPRRPSRGAAARHKRAGAATVGHSAWGRSLDQENLMPRELINSDRLHRGVPYHDAAAGSGEPLVFTAGACPLDIDGHVVAPDDIPAQTRQVLENLRVALEDAGCGRDDVIKTTIFVASSSRDDLLAAWGEYEHAYGSDGPPSTLLGVAALGWPEQLVEMEAIAIR